MPIMKYALGQMDVYLFNAIRLTFSALALGVVVWIQKPRTFNREPGATPIRTQAIHIAAFAFMTGFAYQLLFLWGMNGTSAGNTAIIMSAMPMWTAILSWMILKERLSLPGWIGMLIAISGTMVVTLTKAASASPTENTLVGNLLVSLAAFSWALAAVTSRPMMKNTSPITLAFWGVAGTLPLHWILPLGEWAGFSDVFAKPWLVAAIVYSGVFSTGIAIAMWNFGVKKLGPAHAAGFQNLVPLVALLTSWLLIGEVPYLWQIIGGALIILGLIVLRTYRNHGKT